jgi:hypothetical protein
VNRDHTNNSSDAAAQQQQQQQGTAVGIVSSDTAAAQVQFVYGELSGGADGGSSANGKPTAGTNRRSFKLKNMHIR